MDFRRSPIRNLRRWPRIFLFAIYLVILLVLLTTFYNEYVLENISSASNSYSGGIVLGVSLLSDRPQTLLSNLNSEEKATDWSTSFLLQSQSPTIQVFLDYISMYENLYDTQYCFTSFQLGKDINIPIQVIEEFEKNSTINPETDATFGKLKFTKTLPSKYLFELNEPFCLNKGGKYFVPNILLGVISSQSKVSLLGIELISGHRASEFFPFDQQNIALDLTANYKIGNDNFSIHPGLEVSISQQGWIGNFTGINESTVLQLERPKFYKGIIYLFSVMMAIFIITLNNIISVDEGFFEVAFGLLLGLWGTHEILIPEYIESSTLIDLIIYILYMLVIAEIATVFIDELLINIGKRQIKIKKAVIGNLDDECVIIKNYSANLPVDMTGWVLLDRAMNKFKFPVFVLGGQKSVKIWTKDGVDTAKNLYWKRKKEVWNNDEDTIFLEDSHGSPIDNHSYDTDTRNNDIVINNSN